MVDALVVTPVIAEVALAQIVRQLGITSNDVVATASPLSDLGKHIREGAQSGCTSIRGQLLDAVRLSLEAHFPTEVVFLLPLGHTDEALDDFMAFTTWARAEGFDLKIVYRHVDGRMPVLRTIGLTCIDYRLSASLANVEPETTGWLRLPGVEGAFADPDRREEIFTELSRATEGRVITRAVDVRVDPHQDCAARMMRHRKPEHDDAAWYAEDLRIMRKEHEACQRFLKGTNVSTTNPSLNPVRAFGRSGDGEFSLREYDSQQRPERRS